MNAPIKHMKHSRAVKLIAVGNSTGIVLPRDVLDRLGVARGDSVSIVETDDGLELRRHDPDFEEQMTAAREVMQRRRAALRELSK